MRAAVLGALSASFVGRPLSAASEVPLETRIEVNEGECLDERRLEKLVSSALEREHLDPEITVIVTETDRNNYVIDFERGGVRVGLRKFRAKGSDCGEARRAVALLVALGIEAMDESDLRPLAEERAPDETADREKLRAVNEEASRQDAELAPAKPKASSSPVTTHLAMGVAGGVLPSPNFTAALGLDWRMSESDVLSTNLRFSPFISAEPESYRGPLQGLVALQLAACWNLLKRLSACAGLNGGIFQYRYGEFVHKDFWFSGSVTVELETPKFGNFFGLARLDTHLAALDRPGLSHLVGFGMLGIGANY